MNKITHVVNCSSDYIENFFQKKGIKYYSLNWKEYQVRLLLSFVKIYTAHGSDRGGDEWDLNLRPNSS